MNRGADWGVLGDEVFAPHLNIAEVVEYAEAVEGGVAEDLERGLHCCGRISVNPWLLR